MRFELATVEDWSSKTRFRQIALEKCALLAYVLGEICLDPFLESRLVIKGESSVQLLADQPVRLPGSLSFLYAGENNWKQFVRDREEVLERLDLIGKEFALEVEIKDFQDRTTIEYSWTNHFRQSDYFVTEIDWTERCHIHPLHRGVVWTPLGSGAFNALCLSNVELGAVLAREALATASAKPVHDLVLFAERMGNDWGSSEMRRTFTLIGSTLPRPLREYSPQRIEMLTQREVDMSLNPGLKLGESIRAISIISEAQKALAKLFAFDKEELSYLETLELGHFEPEILFPRRPELSAELQKVPAYRFKGVGARKLLPAKHAQPKVSSTGTGS